MKITLNKDIQDLIPIVEQSERDEQSGEGLIDSAFKGYNMMRKAKKIFNKSKNVTGALTNLYSSAPATKLKNMLPNSDETGRPAYEGEAHSILKLPNGKLGSANYCGPGTKVVERIARGDPPRTDTDKACQAHDLRYTMATQLSQLSEADNKMIKALDRSNDHKINTSLHKNIIKSKKWAESYKLLNKDQFSGDLNSTFESRGITDENEARMEAKLANLNQEGYGKKSVPLKSDKLKRKVIKDLAKQKKKKKELN